MIYLYIRQTQDRYFFMQSPSFNTKNNIGFCLGEIFNGEDAFSLLVKNDPYYEGYDFDDMLKLKKEVFLKFLKFIKQNQ